MGGQIDEPATRATERGAEQGVELHPGAHQIPYGAHNCSSGGSARQLQDKDVEDLQGWVCGILGQGKLPKYNLLREQRKALKELRDLEDGVT